jgi:hypothetical protein
MTIFAKTVGVAPGTTTLQLGGYRDPYQDMIQLSGVDTSAHIRWDLIALVGGGSLFIAMMAGLVASALEHKFAAS